MKKIQIFSRAGWTALLLFSLNGLIQAPAAVAWLLATLSSVTPLTISLFLTKPQWDRSFLSIAVASLCLVAIAVCLGQWAVLDATPASLSLAPFLSLILWLVHERFGDRKMA